MSEPGLSWDVMLKMTKMKLALLILLIFREDCKKDEAESFTNI